jgi:hypothetical protein
MEPNIRYGAAAIVNSCRFLFPRPFREAMPRRSRNRYQAMNAARCGAANAAAALVNINENTSAAVDGNAADRGREGSGPLKSLGKAARGSRCSASCGTDAAIGTSANNRPNGAER